MADLDPLIRFRKFGLQEKQRRLAQLYEEMEALQIRKSNVLDQIAYERKVAEELATIEAMSSFTGFAQRMRTTLEQINATIAQVETRIQIAQDDMREAFGDLKKIEITQRRRLEEIAAENRRKEDSFFGEVALSGYRRRLEEE
jgi:flagellar export protein FliJ